LADSETYLSSGAVFQAAYSLGNAGLTYGSVFGGIGGPGELNASAQHMSNAHTAVRGIFGPGPGPALNTVGTGLALKQANAVATAATPAAFFSRRTDGAPPPGRSVSSGLDGSALIVGMTHLADCADAFGVAGDRRIRTPTSSSAPSAAQHSGQAEEDRLRGIPR
jgi:hypothetical protein